MNTSFSGSGELKTFLDIFSKEYPRALRNSEIIMSAMELPALCIETEIILFMTKLSSNRLNLNPLYISKNTLEIK